ncbi:MAG: ComF family protein [Lachnospiraceae bacterium]|nr:ComF family protein [Lachnospiraceae bacterium]
MNFFKTFLDIVYPKVCPFCDGVIPMKQHICVKCASKVDFVKEPRCKKCGKPVIKEEQEYCEDCGDNRHLYNCGIASFVYSDVVKKSIYRFKYHNRRDYAVAYGNMIGNHFKREIDRWGAEALIPVPIHRKKLHSRGYNQAKLLSDELSKILNIPVDNQLLIRCNDTKPQKELSVCERRRNLENAFKITENVVKYRKIILVDDIYTTGSTIDACARVLLECGVKEIYYISLSIGAGV